MIIVMVRTQYRPRSHSILASTSNSIYLSTYIANIFISVHILKTDFSVSMVMSNFGTITELLNINLIRLPGH